MTQSIPRVPFGNIRDPNDIVQGATMETRIYYRPATKTSFIEKSTGKQLKPLTPEITKEIRRRIALGEVEERIEPTWIPTTPLPADAWHMNKYVKKGFRLWPPGQEPNQETQDALQARIKELETELAEVAKTGIDKESNPLACQREGCSFIGKTFLGLARHMRSQHDQK